MNSSNDSKPAAALALRFARIGSISHGTLRTEDLLSRFVSELEGHVLANGAFLSCPENFPMRDRLAKLIGEAQDAYSEDGETLADEEAAAELVNELQDALAEFAPPYVNFGTHEGDGSDFGFWPNVEDAKENVGFVSVSDRASREFKEDAGCDPEDSSHPAADYRGEWLHVNDHGNATLYVREDGKVTAVNTRAPEYFDREVWSVV